MSAQTDTYVKIAVCEDNEIQREMMTLCLANYVEVHPEVKVSAFASGTELLAAIRGGASFDIYILDILMPGMNGMEVAATLRMMHDDGLIIFMTATVDYAVMSYEVNAFYYMMKPVDFEKLNKVLDNALGTIGKKQSETLTVKTQNGIFKLELPDILYVEVVDRAAVFYMRDGRECRSISLRKSFRDTVPQLFESRLFASCGVSRLVNLSCVDAIDSESLLLSNGQVVFFPKSTYSELKKRWTDYRRV